ncbi:LPXTG cell wall anchor domain-containing protein [Candidatus Altiarchaeota archaeon]
MRKTIVVLFVFGFLSSLISMACAAPAPRGIAVNNEAGECTGFWPGDEFTVYELPEGWDAHYPDYEKHKSIKGECIPGREDCEGKFQCFIGEVNLEIPRCYDYQGQCQSGCEVGIIEVGTDRCYYQLFQDESCCGQLGYTYTSKDIGKKRTTSFGYQNLLSNNILYVIAALLILVIVAGILLKRRK